MSNIYNFNPIVSDYIKKVTFLKMFTAALPKLYCK